MTTENCNLQAYANAQASQLVEYQVTDSVLLAGQPQPEDWSEIVKRGYTTVINMRSDPKRASIEEKNVKAVGMRYIHLPLPVYELEPKHLVIFNQTITNLNNEKVFIHCRSATRVGLLWMLNRINHQAWSTELAEAELKVAGYNAESLETFEFCSEDYLIRVELEMEEEAAAETAYQLA